MNNSSVEATLKTSFSIINENVLFITITFHELG